MHSLRGKEHIEHDNPYDVGMTGLVGFASGYPAMKACDMLLMLGTDFPYRQFYPEDAKIAQIDVRPEALGNRCSLDLGLVGDVKDTLAALLPRSSRKRPIRRISMRRSRITRRRGGLSTTLAESSPSSTTIHPQYLSRLVSQLASRRRDLHLRRRNADRLDGALSEDERQAPADRFVQSRLDGERDAACDRRAGGVSRPPGDLDVR